MTIKALKQLIESLPDDAIMVAQTESIDGEPAPDYRETNARIISCMNVDDRLVPFYPHREKEQLALLVNYYDPR